MSLRTNLPNHWPVNSDWTDQLSECFVSKWFHELVDFLEVERKTNEIYPAAEDVFQAFQTTSFAETKVIILGQDPYHGAGQAHGLSFSVLDGVKHPPSLRNIFKELHSDIGIEPPLSGNLSHWAKQGVLLLNTVLSVRAGEANSHRKKGWEQFTDSVIQSLNGHPAQLVFILWGAPAQKKEKLIDNRHLLIKSPHPSPLSAHRGFFGSKPFSQANQFLKEIQRPVIDWAIEPNQRWN